MALCMVTGCDTPALQKSKPASQTSASAGEDASSTSSTTAPPPPSAQARAPAPKSAAEKQLSDDAERFRAVLFGNMLAVAMKRGPTAIAACLWTHRNNEKARTDCVKRVTVAVAIAGFSESYVLARKDEEGRTRVRAIQSVADDIRADNARLQAVVDASTAVLNESRERLAQMRSDLNGKRIALGDAQAARKREEDNLAVMQKALDDAQATRTEYVKAAADPKLNGSKAEKDAIDAQVKVMNAKIEALQKNIKALGDALVVSRV